MKAAVLTLVALIGGGVLAPAAHAQCSNMGSRPVAWGMLPEFAKVQPQAVKTADAGATEQPQPMRVGEASIVGLWNVTFTSSGQVVDQAFEVFHSDGTEIMNDTADPASGNVCLGVWARLDGLQFKLNHPSWTFDSKGGLNGTATIKVNLTLDPNGMGFTGTFTIDVLTLANVNVLHLSGQVTGHRILVD